jgi:hypothetical protein
MPHSFYPEWAHIDSHVGRGFSPDGLPFRQKGFIIDQNNQCLIPFFSQIVGAEAPTHMSNLAMLLKTHLIIKSRRDGSAPMFYRG